MSIIQKYEDFFNIEFPLPKQGTTLSRLLYYWSRSYLSGLLKIGYFMQLFNYVIPQFCIKLRGYKIVNTNFFCLIYICPKIKNKFLKSTKCDSTGWSASIFIRSYGNGWGWPCLFLRNQWKQVEYEFTCCTLNYWGKLTRISTQLSCNVLMIVAHHYTLYRLWWEGAIFFFKGLFIYTVCICRDGFSLRLLFRIQGPDFLSES